MSGHKASIRIDNGAGYSLRAVDVYEWYGYTVAPSRDVAPNSSDQDFRGGIYQGTWGVAAGTSGLLCYELVGANPTAYLVLLWSIPKWSARRNFVSVKFFRNQPNLYDESSDMFNKEGSSSTYESILRGGSVQAKVTIGSHNDTIIICRLAPV